jgi:hypothetical protein
VLVLVLKLRSPRLGSPAEEVDLCEIADFVDDFVAASAENGLERETMQKLGKEASRGI